MKSVISQQKMNPDVKTLWINALRSGEYLQGRGKLKTPNDKFCCLGILCDLYHKTTGFGSWEKSIFNDGEDSNEFYLPLAVQSWAGLPSRSPARADRSLSGHNDGGKTLIEISDIINDSY